MKACLVVLLLIPAPSFAQDTLHLAELQATAVMHDPRLRQVSLRETATELRLRNLAVERLPALRLIGDATYQSEVARIPLESSSVPTPPKDRYDVALESDWLLYDGGALSARGEAERASLAAQRAEIVATLYPLRVEVLDAYFDALLLQERMVEQAALIEDLGARLAEVRDRVEAGAALPGDTAAVRVEMLRAMQRLSVLESDRHAALAVLARLTGHDVAMDDVLAIPALDAEVARVRAADSGAVDERAGVQGKVHPQYAVFATRREQLEREAALVRAGVRPQVGAFGMFGYGRPGLAQFTDDLHGYWLAGVRFRWTPWTWGKTARDIELVRMGQEVIDTDEAAFTEHLLRQVQPSIAAMDRLREMLVTDEQIIVLREQLERQARAQFAERAITAADYVDARTDLLDARTALTAHRAELARAQATYLTMLGVRLQR